MRQKQKRRNKRQEEIERKINSPAYRAIRLVEWARQHNNCYCDRCGCEFNTVFSPHGCPRCDPKRFSV